MSVNKEYITFKEYLQLLVYDNIIEGVAKVCDVKEWRAKLLLRKTNKRTEAVKKYREYTDMLDLVFGQFIALENIITRQSDHSQKLLDIALFVIRKDGDEIFDNTNLVAEEKHKQDILNEPYPYVMSRIDKYFNIRDVFINKTFDGVFYKKKDDDSEDEEEDTSSVNNNDGNWYWYSLIRTLANEDITNYEEVRMLPMDVVAPEVAYLRYTQVKEEQERKLNEFKRKAQNGVN